MGKQQSKEQEIIIAQNGAGNSASTEQLLWHATSTSYALIAICALLFIGAAIILFRYYRKCHGEWIQRGIDAYDLRRSMSMLRRQQRESAASKDSPV